MSDQDARTIPCPRCGAAVRGDQDWCLACGAAARTRLVPTPNWRLPVVLVVAVVLAALVALGVAFVALTDEPRTVTVPAPTTAAPVPAPVPTTAVPAPGTTVAPTTPGAPVVPTTPAVPGAATATTPAIPTTPTTGTAPGATTATTG